MERDYLEWVNKAYRALVDNSDIPKMELKTFDGGKISVYRCDIKRPETKRV